VILRQDQCSRSRYVDYSSCLISEYLAFIILHDVFASRHLHIRMSRNDYTVPTRCRPRGGMVDSPCYTACRALRQLISHTIKYLITQSKSFRAIQFAVIRRFVGIGSHASEYHYRSYTVDTSGVNRLASQNCYN
jgi:hypothetical protein